MNDKGKEKNYQRQGRERETEESHRYRSMYLISLRRLSLHPVFQSVTRRSQSIGYKSPRARWEFASSRPASVPIGRAGGFLGTIKSLYSPYVNRWMKIKSRPLAIGRFTTDRSTGSRRVAGGASPLPAGSCRIRITILWRPPARSLTWIDSHFFSYLKRSE